MTNNLMHFTARDVREGLQRIVDRSNPNKRASDGGNTGCVYGKVENGVLVAVCIIGQYIADLGFLGLLLDGGKPDYGNDYSTPGFHGACTIGSSMWDALAAAGVTFDEDAKALSRYTQDAQDSGYKWSDALRYGTARTIHDAKVTASENLGVPFTGLSPAPGDFFTEDVPEVEPLAPWERELLNP
ncbi:MAG TPA: hypothetical protein VMR98_06265 [Candidatus Polarisedimenticolaceae bacterium]|nr:hypothetical protein [Candidatus Polarisedimenticolaceae bacterium]